MTKIIKITKDNVLVGMEDGSIEEFKKEELNFSPALGDEVQVFKAPQGSIVSKASSAWTDRPVYYQEQGRSVNKVVYCLLAFFFGGLGFHKFYAGKVAAGILYILFVWTFIPALVAFIDLIIGLTRPADANGNIIV